MESRSPRRFRLSLGASAPFGLSPVSPFAPSPFPEVVEVDASRGIISSLLHCPLRDASQGHRPDAGSTTRMTQAEGRRERAERLSESEHASVLPIDPPAALLARADAQPPARSFRPA
jgi:hypothetical protein